MRLIIICIRHLAKLDVICRSQMLSAEPAGTIIKDAQRNGGEHRNARAYIF